MSVEEQANAVGRYYKNFKPPKTKPDGTPTTDKQKEAYKKKFEKLHGQPPEPPTIPGPPAPGAGMPAARLGDLTAHGGTIGPVTTGVVAGVNIAGIPAACMGDPHVCPMWTALKPHVGGVITKGSMSVMIAGKPAARISDLTTCTPEPGAIALGEMSVLIGE
jgi:uncharacterized Zn-binding protein involved in type VI secretion